MNWKREKMNMMKMHEYHVPPALTKKIVNNTRVGIEGETGKRVNRGQ